MTNVLILNNIGFYGVVKSCDNAREQQTLTKKCREECQAANETICFCISMQRRSKKKKIEIGCAPFLDEVINPLTQSFVFFFIPSFALW